MPLGPVLERICRDYPAAVTETFAKHPTAGFIRGEAARAVETGAGLLGEGLVFQGSAGRGRFADVP